MAEKKKRIRRSKEELKADPNYRDQSGGNRSRKVNGKTRRQRGVDERFSDPSDKIARLERESKINDVQISKWRDRLEETLDSQETAQRSNREDKEKEKTMRAKGKTYMASMRFGADDIPARKELSQALAKSTRIENEIRRLKQQL